MAGPGRIAAQEAADCWLYDGPARGEVEMLRVITDTIGGQVVHDATYDSVEDAMAIARRLPDYEVQLWAAPDAVGPCELRQLVAESLDYHYRAEIPGDDIRLLAVEIVFRVQAMIDEFLLTTPSMRVTGARRAAQRGPHSHG